MEKLKILGDAAKYDVACTSSGVDRENPKDGIGGAVSYGLCHSFAADGRCISLLKILMSNVCSYDCAYCVNRKSNDLPRAAFLPRELAELVINFYRRNYIEGLFLSSAVLGTPTRTVELMCEALKILREEYKFYGYIHAKVIPGADPDALDRLGCYADRMSVNIELPSEESLGRLAPDKSRDDLLRPMGHIRNRIIEQKNLPALFNGNVPALRGAAAVKRFAPAGQSTQIIIGASPETDYSILKLSEAMYARYDLRRVFYSAYIPVVENSLLPAPDTKPPLLRENRLYQADWLLRQYAFKADEILDEKHPNFNPYLDPKCNWAVNHPEFFPVEINRAPYETLLRVPGLGVLSAKKIIKQRGKVNLNFSDLKKLGVVLKRAQYFITCGGRTGAAVRITEHNMLSSLLSESALKRFGAAVSPRQLSIFDSADEFDSAAAAEETVKCLTGQM
jgi:putative DNA modification/repair radical SAM protein